MIITAKQALEQSILSSEIVKTELETISKGIQSIIKLGGLQYSHVFCEELIAFQRNALVHYLSLLGYKSSVKQVPFSKEYTLVIEWR